ncbi:MAG: hypothetical protein SGCHY_003139 [Lobulomycetales sp.]
MAVDIELPTLGPVSVHDRWIRERCACAKCVQDVTKQPLYYTSTAKVKDLKKDEHYYEFTFEDDHIVKLPLEQLGREMQDFKSTCAVQSTLDVSIPQPEFWNKETFPEQKFCFDDMLGSEQTRMMILESLLKYGIVVISEMPREKNTVLNFSRELLGSVRETHWGIVFDVKASPPTEGVSHDLAYSGAEIEFHVDNPYRTPCIDYQLLHCIKTEGVAVGEGLNRFVDAVGCAEILRKEDPEAFEILSTTAVKWENDYPHMTLCPMIELRTNGQVRRVFHSLKSGGYAPPLSPEKLKKFYDAKDKLISLFEDEKNVIYHTMKEGDLVFFGNTRVLHSRTSFNPVKASRHLQGMYVDHDAVTSALWRYRANISSLSKEPAPDTAFKPKWSALREATEEELDVMAKTYQKDCEDNQVQRVMDLLTRQKGDHTKLGAPVDLYTHGLQTATRAYNAGEDDDMVVAALLHDVGELFVPASHGEFSASLLRPYVSEKVHWILQHHEIFQMKNYGENGCNLDVIEKFRGMPHFDACEKFCAEYDQPSFDPAFEPLPLSVFEPIVKRVFARKPFWNAPNDPKAHCVLQL